MNRLGILLLFFTLMLTGKNLHSQKIFREGYVVKKSGEAMNGLIEFSMNQSIPSVCVFKRFDIAKTVSYKPEEIKAFGYDGGNRYESKQSGGEVTFFEVIVTGKIVIYQKKSKFFLEKDNESFIELASGPISYTNEKGKSDFNSLNDFLDFITEGKAGSFPEKATLKNDLIPYIIVYNKASGSPYSVTNRRISEEQLAQKSLESDANKYRIGVMSGINIYNLTLTPFNNTYVPDPEPELSSITGLTIQRLISRKNDRLSLRLDLLYFSPTFYCYNERTINLGGTYRNDAWFSFSGIKMPLFLQYSLTGRRFIPYFNAGVAYQYLIKNDYLRIEEAENVQNIIITSEYNDQEFKSGEVSGLAGIGARIRLLNNLSLHLEGRLEVGSGVFRTYRKNDRYITQNSIQTTFLLGITF